METVVEVAIEQHCSGPEKLRTYNFLQKLYHPASRPALDLATQFGDLNVFELSKSADFLRRADRLWPYILIVISVVGFLYRAVR
jgi:hypothetical protein